MLLIYPDERTVQGQDEMIERDRYNETDIREMGEVAIRVAKPVTPCVNNWDPQ